MSGSEAIKRLEQMPLLGPNREQFKQELSALKQSVHPDTPPEFAGRLLVLEARLRLTRPGPDTVLFLSRAELWARSMELESTACRLRLMWCRAVAEQDAASLPTGVLDATVAQAQQLGGLEADWRMALAATGSADAQALLEQSMGHLHSDSHAFEQMSIQLLIGAIRHDGGDTEGAIRFFNTALQIADAHDAQDHQASIASMLGQLYLAQGQARLAAPVLTQALQLTETLDDTLGVVVNGTLISALHLGAGRWENAREAAQGVERAAQRRGNWLAVADAQITLATCLVQEGQLASAVEAVLTACMRLQTEGTSASINLLKGYLVELRHSVGAEAFDALFEASVNRHTPSQPSPT